MIAERLIGARAAKGWTQRELAKVLNVHIRTVQNWEGSLTEPGGEDLRNLSTTLGVSIPYLIGQTDNPELPTLQETPPETELAVWKRRAVNAEKQLHDLRNGLRALLDLSSGSQATGISPESVKAAENLLLLAGELTKPDRAKAKPQTNPSTPEPPRGVAPDPDPRHSTKTPH